MIHALLIPVAGVDDTGGGAGVLTLVFPLVLVFIVAALWWAWWVRRSRNG
jgi:hypothetical protein